MELDWLDTELYTEPKSILVPFIDYVPTYKLTVTLSGLERVKDYVRRGLQYFYIEALMKYEANQNFWYDVKNTAEYAEYHDKSWYTMNLIVQGPSLIFPSSIALGNVEASPYLSEKSRKIIVSIDRGQDICPI